jgi:hypothetical protein
MHWPPRIESLLPQTAWLKGLAYSIIAWGHKVAGHVQIEETQGSYAANRGAEAVIYQRELMRAQSEGRTLLNIDQPIGPRNPNARGYIDAYQREW